MARAPTFVAASLGTAAELELATAVQIWREAQEALARAVDAERVARDAIVSKYFTDTSEGTHTGSMREHNLKCTFPINRSVVAEQYEAAKAFALEHPSQGEHLLALMSQAFRAKMEVSVKEWKAMSPGDRMKLADIVTEKPGSPQLKLEPKK